MVCIRFTKDLVWVMHEEESIAIGCKRSFTEVHVYMCACVNMHAQVCIGLTSMVITKINKKLKI